MKTERSSGTNVTSMLERREPGASIRPGASFSPAGLEPAVTEPDLVLLPDMEDMNARQVVETIAKVLASL